MIDEVRDLMIRKSNEVIAHCAKMIHDLEENGCEDCFIVMIHGHALKFDLDDQGVVMSAEPVRPMDADRFSETEAIVAASKTALATGLATEVVHLVQALQDVIDFHQGILNMIETPSTIN